MYVEVILENLESLETVFKGSIFCMPALQDLLSRDTDLWKGILHRMWLTLMLREQDLSYTQKLFLELRLIIVGPN